MEGAVSFDGLEVFALRFISLLTQDEAVEYIEDVVETDVHDEFLVDEFVDAASPSQEDGCKTSEVAGISYVRGIRYRHVCIANELKISKRSKIRNGQNEEVGMRECNLTGNGIP